MVIKHIGINTVNFNILLILQILIQQLIMEYVRRFHKKTRKSSYNNLMH